MSKPTLTEVINKFEELLTLLNKYDNLITTKELEASFDKIV